MKLPLLSFRLSVAIGALITISAARAEPLYSDSFAADAKVPERRAMRGDWQITGGVAQCTQDDALYKKFKDHGPIIFYDLATTDATFRYAFKPQGCQTVVFTLNGQDGHVFRFVSTPQRGTDFRAFPPSDDHKSVVTHRAADWKLVDGEWTPVTVAIKGDTATVRFGDAAPVEVKHETYAKSKTNFSIGFSFGSLAVKDVTVTK